MKRRERQEKINVTAYSDKIYVGGSLDTFLSQIEKYKGLKCMITQDPKLDFMIRIKQTRLETDEEFNARLELLQKEKEYKILKDVEKKRKLENNIQLLQDQLKKT